MGTTHGGDAILIITIVGIYHLAGETRELVGGAVNVLVKATELREANPVAIICLLGTLASLSSRSLRRTDLIFHACNKDATARPL